MHIYDSTCKNNVVLANSGYSPVLGFQTPLSTILKIMPLY